MKLIITKNLSKLEKSKKKNDRKFLHDYWELEYPEDYVEELIAQCSPTNIIKISESLDEVEMKGVLKETKDGFVYLNIPDKIIDAFLPLLDKAKKPPYFSSSYSSIGAHISVIGDSERKENNIKNIKEIGKEFSFILKGLFSTKPKGWEEMKKIWFLSLESKELEDLRKSYGLSGLKKGNKFHITVGVERK